MYIWRNYVKYRADREDLALRSYSGFNTKLFQGSHYVPDLRLVIMQEITDYDPALYSEPVPVYTGFPKITTLYQRFIQVRRIVIDCICRLDVRFAISLGGSRDGHQDYHFTREHFYALHLCANPTRPRQRLKQFNIPQPRQVAKVLVNQCCGLCDYNWLA